MTNQELFEQAVAGNWIAESFDPREASDGIGKFYLSGSSKGYSTFSDSIDDGQVVFYAAFDDDCNREAGYGIFNADDMSITPVETTATLRNDKYIDGDVAPVPFPNGGTITGTFNAVAFNAIWAHIWDKNNPHEVIAEQVDQDNENNLGDNVQDALDNLSGIIEEWDAAIKATCQNYVQELPPPNPQKGDMWTDVGVTGEQYVWEGEYWVSVTGGGLGINLEDPESLPNDIVRDDVQGNDELYDKPLVRVISSYAGEGHWELAPTDGGGGGGADGIVSNGSNLFVGSLDPDSPTRGDQLTTLGHYNKVDRSGGTAVGYGAQALGDQGPTAIGWDSKANHIGAVAFGPDAQALHFYGIALGREAATTKDYEFAISPYTTSVNFSGATVQAADFIDADGNSIVGGGGDADLTGYATEAYVDQAIAETPKRVSGIPEVGDFVSAGEILIDTTTGTAYTLTDASRVVPTGGEQYLRRTGPDSIEAIPRKFHAHRTTTNVTQNLAQYTHGTIEIGTLDDWVDAEIEDSDMNIALAVMKVQYGENLPTLQIKKDGKLWNKGIEAEEHISGWYLKARNELNLWDRATVITTGGTFLDYDGNYLPIEEDDSRTVIAEPQARIIVNGGDFDHVWSFKTAIQAPDYLDADGNSATVSPATIIDAFTTIQKAIADETTVEGIKTALTNSLGGLIEKFEAMNDNG